MRVHFLAALLLILSCSRTPLKDPLESVRRVDWDNHPTIEVGQDFHKALELTVERLDKQQGRVLNLGRCELSAKDYAKFLNSFPKDQTALNDFLSTQADWLEVYGRSEWSEIMLTSYFSPLYEARKKPEPPFIQPVYKMPEDLVEVSLASFASEDLANLNTDRKVVSARITNGPGTVQRIVPYFSREDIDIKQSLSGRKLELAYLRPIDAFFLQIQGSGKVRFKNGEELSLGYAAQNGYRYKSIGKLLYHVIPKEEMSMARIEDYLRSLNTEGLYEFLSQNPSYVFFKDLEAKPAKTTYGIRVFDRITLAVDPKFFPLGLLGVLHYPIPQFGHPEATSPDNFVYQNQLVFSHDTGGAIKGADRADLYWGEGRVAQQSAGVLKHPANLWFLVPKNSCPL